MATAAEDTEVNIEILHAICMCRSRARRGKGRAEVETGV